MQFDRLKRRDFITLVGGAAAAWPLAARAQQAAERMRRIRVLMSGAADRQGHGLVSALQQGLAGLGWANGGNMQIDYHWGAGSDERIKTHAVELVALSPDVIVATGTQVTAALLKQTRTVPIVFVNVADPVESGFVESFSRPGGNATGFAAWELSIGGKWLELLLEIGRSIERVMVLINPANPTWVGHQRTIEAAARMRKVQIAATRVTSSDEIRSAIELFGRMPAGGMIVLPSGLTTVNRVLIADMAVRFGLPAVYPYAYFAESGGLLAFGTDTRDLYRRAASYVDRILKGEKPADLPVQQPTKFELVINLKTAKALGLTVPDTLLARADEVIE